MCHGDGVVVVGEILIGGFGDTLTRNYYPFWSFYRRLPRPMSVLSTRVYFSHN